MHEGTSSSTSGNRPLHEQLSPEARTKAAEDLIEDMESLPWIADRIEQGTHTMSQHGHSVYSAGGAAQWALGEWQLERNVRRQNPLRRKLGLEEITTGDALDMTGFNPVEPQGSPPFRKMPAAFEEEIGRIREIGGL